jgi:hypothetical protein
MRGPAAEHSGLPCTQVEVLRDLKNNFVLVHSAPASK